MTAEIAPFDGSKTADGGWRCGSRGAREQARRAPCERSGPRGRFGGAPGGRDPLPGASETCTGRVRDLYRARPTATDKHRRAGEEATPQPRRGRARCGPASVRSARAGQGSSSARRGSCLQETPRPSGVLEKLFSIQKGATVMRATRVMVKVRMDARLLRQHRLGAVLPRRFEPLPEHPHAHLSPRLAREPREPPRGPARRSRLPDASGCTQSVAQNAAIKQILF